MIKGNSSDVIYYHIGNKQNARHVTNAIVEFIFSNDIWCIYIRISLIFVSKGISNNKQAFYQIMDWCCIGDKSLFELAHICASFGLDEIKQTWQVNMSDFTMGSDFSDCL